MPTPLTSEELTEFRVVADHLETLIEAADVAVAALKKAEGEKNRHLRNLRIKHDVTDDRMGLHPITGEWAIPPQQQGQPTPSAPPPQRLPLLPPDSFGRMIKRKGKGR